MKKIKRLSSWVKNLDEVGDVITSEARRIDSARAELLLQSQSWDDREKALIKSIKKLWEKSEISAAKILNNHV